MQTKQKSKRIGPVAVTGAFIAGGYALAFPATSGAALLSNVAFNDTLASNGSTLDSASQSQPNTATPTATSTNYDVASNKEAVGTPNSNLTSGNPLELDMASSSSGIAEVQGLFTTTPIQLTTIGQSVEITVTFKDTAGLNQNGSSAIYVGLYSSGGSAPYNNLGNGSSSTPTITGLANTEINDNSAGTQNWVGYEADYFGGASTKMYLRPAEATSANNIDQALVGATQTGGEASSTLATPVSQNADTALTVGNTYTDEMEITLSSAGVYTLVEGLYSGTTDTTLVGTEVTTETISTTLAGGAGFDAFAIGYRQSDSLSSEMDISQVEVTTNVPEPASLAILGIAAAPLMGRRRRR
jgi:hypothetical protein